MKPDQKYGILIIVFLLVVSFITNAEAGRRYRSTKSTTIKLGYFSPKDANSGFLFGVNMGNAVDELVDIGINVDIFHRSYQRDVKLSQVELESGLIEVPMQRELEFSTTAVPIMGTLRLKFGSRTPFTYFLGGGFGYELMWNKESNYVESTNESRFYNGWTWQVSGGAMHRLGSRSYIIGEVFYNDAHLKRDRGKTVNGFPKWTEVNFSGFGFRFGIQFGG